MGSDRRDRAGEVSISNLIGSFMSGPAMERASDNRRAGAAWYKANGDTERRHTTGVFLREDVTKGKVLCVYVDSNAVMVEFNAMRQMYVARLSAQGFEVDGVQFLLSREGYKTWMDREKDDKSQPVGDLPPLGEDEERRVAELLETELPEGLRESVERALRLSYRREKEVKEASSNSTPKDGSK